MDRYDERAKTRLLSKIKVVGNCWVRTISVHTDGYSVFDYKGRDIMSHRASYLLFKGDLDPKLTIDHLCRNRACINPEHLEQVTMKENVHRSPFTRASINSKKTHCPQGHKYTTKNTKMINTGKSRKCRICDIKQKRKHYDKNIQKIKIRDKLRQEMKKIKC